MKLAVTGQYFTELLRHFLPVAGQQHPQILHRRSAATIVEINEMRPRFSPQDVPCMAIAVQTYLSNFARVGKASFYRIEQLLRDSAIRIDQFTRNPVAGQQKRQRLAPEGSAIECRALAKRT